MKKSKFVAYAAMASLGMGIMGAGVASAHGLFWNVSSPEQIAANQLTAFQHEAAMLGVSVDELKNEWAQGKSLEQIAQDHGITKEQLQQKMKDARVAQIKTSLQALVTNGVITQAQADARLQSIQNNRATHPGRRGGRRMGLGW
jgi:DNA-binding phage protein